jgi:cell division transport system permease protein
MFINGFMSFASVLVIAACLLITGSFSLLSVNIDSIIAALEQQNKIVVFINETYSDEQARAIQPEIEKIDNIREAHFISRAEALESFMEQHRDNRLFDEIDESVFRDRYEISLYDIAYTDVAQNSLANISGIVKINAHLEISRGFVALRNIVTLVCGALIVILFIVSLFIMSNTIKLSTFSRREEIAITRMIGATGRFIRTPYIIEGIVLGLAGSGIAVIAQSFLYNFATGRLAASQVLPFITLLPFGVLSLPVALAFAAVGLLIGVGGSLSAIRQYLKI